MNFRNFLLATVLAGGSGFSGMAHAQDVGTSAATGTVGGAGRGHRLSFLSGEDKQHLLRVRRQVFQSDPDLKTETESLRKEMQFVKSKGSDATAEDKATLRNNAQAHMEKIDAAMVKADPTVQPILDQIKAHLKERFQQGGAAQGGGDSDNS